MPVATDRITDLRTRLRRFTRRRRRPLAALLTVIGVVIALSSLRGPAPSPSPTVPDGTVATRLATGEAAVPIVLSSAALVRTVTRGQIVDIARVPREGVAAASIVVRRARILDIPDGSSTFSASSTPVIVVAVGERDVLPLVATSSRDSLTLVIRGPDENR